jgi:putative endopeptidase
LDKLSRLKVKIGYPNEWRDYSRLEIRPNELVDNVHNAKIFDWLRRVARLNLPVDRYEWDMTPQTVNTGYSSNLNEVVLPAGSCKLHISVQQLIRRSTTGGSVLLSAMS